MQKKTSCETQDILNQIRLGMDELMTGQQRKTFQKILIIYKELSKNLKENPVRQKEDVEKYFYSLKQQLVLLKKDILNHKMKEVSDYEAFLWLYELCEKQNNIFPFIEKKPLMNCITLPTKTKKKILSGQHNNNNNALEKMVKIDFCPLGHSINELIILSEKILFSNVYCQKNFNSNTINKLVSQMSKEYGIVSYHNFTHAFSVQLMIFQCITKTDKLNNIISDFQIFISYIAALSHDMGHSGTNSDFQIKMKSEIAQIYNNESVLENMHISKFYKMLRKHPQIDIISQIKDPVERQSSKRLLVKLILGTDMTKHFDGINKLKEISITDLDQLELTKKQIIYENLFHACDIGNCCLAFEDYLNWALLLSYEFNSQYETQLKENIFPTVLFKYEGESQFYKGQIGFINYFAAPLWKGLHVLYPKLEEFIKNIQTNKEKLQIKLR